jgi:iron complex outermembrane receptor protein
LKGAIVKKIKIKSIYLSLLIALPMTGSLMVPNIAHAQLEEIIVTARARVEALQDVPATITAFSENQIVTMGVARAQDFVAMTPGVTFTQSVETGDSSLSIRGISGARDGETNFAFIVDGILHTNPSAFNREYPDLTQIEVLKGPQGALYGRSAAGGAVIMSTRRPSDEFEGKVKVSAAENATYTGLATIAGPLGENVAGRLTLDHRTSDGFQKNVYLNDKVVDDFEETGITARLVFDPSDTLSIDTKLRHSKIEAGAISFNAAFELPFYVGFLDGAGLRDFGVVPESASIDVNDFQFVFSPNVDPENEQETIEFSIKVDKELDVGTLSAWALYSDMEQHFIADGTSGAFGFYNSKDHCLETAAARSVFLGDGTPMAQPTFNLAGFGPGGNPFFPPYSPTTCDGYQYQERNQEDLSMQVQLTSSGDGPLRWQVGAYFLNIERTVGVAQLEDDNRSYLPRSFVNELTDALVLDDFTTDVIAVFGSVNYDISDQMELAFAIRYDREKREVENKVPSPADGFLSTNIDYCQTFFEGGCTLDGVPLNGTPWNPAFIDLDTGAVSATVSDRSETFDAIQPKVSVTYDMSDDTTLFASWGVGFKTGGFNNLGGTATIELYLVNPDGLPIAPPEIYEEETTSAFELGFTSTVLDGSLQLNGALFHTDVDDMQFFEFYVGPFGLMRTVEAIDEATVKGFEIGASWQATESLRIDAGYSRIGGEIDKMTVRPYVAGNEIPNLAEFTANIALTWDQDWGDLGLMARLEYEHQGEVFYHVTQGSDLDTPRPGDFEGLPLEVPATLQGGLATSYGNTKVDSRGIMNLRVGVSGENWRLTGFARNLLDEEFIAEVILAPEFGGGFVTPGARRSAGLELEFMF